MDEAAEIVKKLFWKSEPELVIDGTIEENGSIVLRLLDCDGYRLGQLVLVGVEALCIAIRRVPYSGFNVFSGPEIYRQAPWLTGIELDESLLILLTPSADCDTEDLLLPMLEGVRRGYVVCKNFLFEKVVPGR